YYQHGISRSSTKVPLFYAKSRFNLAIDAVRHPDTGLIVCRSSITDPGNGCVPWNLLGVNVNSQAAIDYVSAAPEFAYRNERLVQIVAAIAFQGEPFELCAGPVSLAFGAEHRREQVRGNSDPRSQANDWYAGNYLPNFGKYHVTEGFVETVVPL